MLTHCTEGAEDWPAAVSSVTTDVDVSVVDEDASVDVEVDVDGKVTAGSGGGGGGRVGLVGRVGRGQGLPCIIGPDPTSFSCSAGRSGMTRGSSPGRDQSSGAVTRSTTGGRVGLEDPGVGQSSEMVEGRS